MKAPSRPALGLALLMLAGPALAGCVTNGDGRPSASGPKDRLEAPANLPDNAFRAEDLLAASAAAIVPGGHKVMGDTIFVSSESTATFFGTYLRRFDERFLDAAGSMGILMVDTDRERPAGVAFGVRVMPLRDPRHVALIEGLVAKDRAAYLLGFVARYLADEQPLGGGDYENFQGTQFGVDSGTVIFEYAPASFPNLRHPALFCARLVQDGTDEVSVLILSAERPEFIPRSFYMGLFASIDVDRDETQALLF